MPIVSEADVGSGEEGGEWGREGGRGLPKKTRTSFVVATARAARVAELRAMIIVACVAAVEDAALVKCWGAAVMLRC